LKFSWQTEEVEWLARVEHERWVAQRELSGWQFHAVRDDAKKLHPDMIPYAELAEERKELDRAAVRDLPALLAQAGFALRRLAEVSVSGPPGACSSSEAHRQAIVAMLEELRSAGREPLLWTDLESEMACAAAELALERGLGRVGIRVRGSAHAVMERQPDDASRARVRRLLARAERVVVEPDAAREPASEAGKGLRLMLSTDGRDLVPSIAAWGIDAAGRVLFRPASLQ
jgi:hypothetical protein